jgi:hypothetical protein
VKFGAAYREAEVTSLTHWGNPGVVFAAAAFGADQNVLELARDAGPAIKQTYKNLYVQDTLTAGNLTVNLGLRYDIQGGDNLARSQPANALLPNILPAVSTSKADIGFEYKDITPRLGLTYALGAERKTLLRASYSRFADQLGTGVGSWLNPLGANGYAYFYTTNTGTPTVTLGQVIDPNNPLFYSGNVNPFTGGLLQSNALDPTLDAPKTDELLLGIEHALLPEFVVGVNLTYRKISDILTADLLVFDGDPYSAANINRTGRPAVASDYVRCGSGAPGAPATCLTGTLPNGQVYNVPFSVLKPTVGTRNGGFLRNGGDEQEYKGAALTFNKRLANRWMLRGNVSYSDWTWSKIDPADHPDPTLFLGGGAREGDAVLQGSGTGSGSKGGIYINSKWSYSINGLYQIAPDRPWGFNVAANLNGRQGYPIPYFRRVNLPANQQFATENVQLTSRPDSVRLDDIHVVDARVEKEFSFSDFGMTLGVDCFNLLNEGYVLQRNHRQQQTSSNFVREVVSPRVLRFGARLSFR